MFSFLNDGVAFGDKQTFVTYVILILYLDTKANNKPKHRIKATHWEFSQR